MATCHACPTGDQDVPDTELPDHVRLLHPDLWGDGPQCWPDGQLVVHDETLQPDDFTRGSRRIVALPRRLAQVLPLIADGLTDPEIADRLGINVVTVRGTVQRLREAYKATNRAHMVALAFRQGDVS